MTAQDLPYDVIGLIVTQLKQILQAELRAKRKFSDARLAPYAAICKSWNPAIERETFRKLTLSDERMESAERALQDPARRSAVKRISFEIAYPKSISRKRDLGEQQLTARDEAFSRRMLRLFRFLECVGSGVQRAGNLGLVLDAVSYCVDPEDADGQPIEESDSDLDSDADSDDAEAGTRLKYDPAPVRYVGEPLPTIHCVQGFELARNGSSNIWPSTFTTILSVMDGLEYCNISFDDAQTLDPGTRMGYRKALGESLRRIPTTLEAFGANFEHQSDGINAAPAHDPGSLDTLSVGLRNLSTQLVELTLEELAISPSLFWPDDGEDAAAPHWPRLKRVHVNYAPTLASGEWLVQPDEEEAELGRQKRPLFADFLNRPVLDCERTNELFLAVGKATRNMPALREMSMEMSNELASEFHFSYKYDNDRKAFVVTWDSYPSDFQASVDVLAAFGIAEAGFLERPAPPAPAKRPRWKKRHAPTGGSIYEGLASPIQIH